MPDTATTLTIDRGVATITLDRPDARNALSADLVDGLADHLEAAVADDDVRVIVLTNAGTTFCAGADLKAGAARSPRHSLVDVLTTMLDSPKPVIGRIAGHCMGGGVGLAAACDISVISDDAKVGFTEVRIGVAPAMISVVCLPKMGRADATELFLSGERITASRAVEAGLLNRVVPRDDLDAAVAEVVGKVVAGGPLALAAAKRLLREVPELDRDEAFATTEVLSAELFASDEAAEGMAAFREKRPARWVPGD
ncbi:enoyl-CoA hydratase-related protein [Acidimicrobiia bacterium EGI L10123]|uniref:enoyl-CoA hydratase/isomerase family protein n=1 Tax=Salinilacustrithrix flava TaxID=2957203 RepID=UPI003D7C1F12|nr:enoyl-CoA hydratase-related protein [Acidimicrobiia bacterium EGI L10123]